MEDIRNQFTHCLRQTIKEKVDDRQDIEEQMKHDLIQYVDVNSPQGKDLDMRLHFLFQKRKLAEFGITDDEMEEVREQQNQSIPKVLYFIADILEDLMGQMDQQEDGRPQKMKSLFLIFSQNDERFKIFTEVKDENQFNLNSSESSEDENDEVANEKNNGDENHEKDIDDLL